MPAAESVEKMRQAVMRYRELLDHLRLRLDSSERDYAALFAALTPEERTLGEKQQQGLAALPLLEDRKPLETALLRIQFDCRDLERAFEELYGIILHDDTPDDD